MSVCIAEWPHQVHPNRREQTEALGHQIDALTDDERSRLLHWLCGYTPAAVQRAVDHLAPRGLPVERVPAGREPAQPAPLEVLPSEDVRTVAGYITVSVEWAKAPFA